MPRIRINCDDFGMHPSINLATVELLRAGAASSASIMPVAPAFEDALRRLEQIGLRNVGVHLALEAEFPRLPMPPLARGARSFVDAGGMLLTDIGPIAKRLDPGEVLRELEAQIERVLDAGLSVTHIDGHMFFYDRPGAPAWLRPMVADLARRHRVPFRLRESSTAMIWDEAQEIDERREAYRRLLHSGGLDGLELIVHPGRDREEMESFTANAVRRLADYLILRDDAPAWLSSLGIEIARE